MPKRDKKRRSAPRHAGAPRSGVAGAAVPEWLWAALLLTALAALAYHPTFGAGFLWDDNEHFLADALMTAPDGLWRIWFNPDASVWNYFPLSRTSFWIERRLWGEEALGYRAVNLGLHTLSAFLLWVLMRRGAPGVGRGWALGAAALFLLHPVNVESVAWITERKNTLSLPLALASALAFAQWADTYRARWWTASVVLFGLALLAKSSVVALPPALALWLWADRRPFGRREALALLPFFLLPLGPAAVSVRHELSVGGSAVEFGLGLLDRILLAARAAWWYLAKLVFPYPLMFNHPKWDLAAEAWKGWAALAGQLALAAALGRAALLGRRGPAAWWLTLLACLFPVAGFFTIFAFRYSWVAEHWAYPASAAFAAGAAWFGSNTVKLLNAGAGGGAGAWAGRAAAAACLAAVTVFGLLAMDHSRAFFSREALWRDTLAKNPNSALAANQLGVLRAQAADYGEALRLFNLSLENRPGNVEALTNRGLLMGRLGKPERAERDFTLAIEAEPESYELRFNRGVVRQEMGDAVGAEVDYSEALRLRPTHSDSLVNRAHLRQFSLGRPRGACVDWGRACELGACRNLEWARSQGLCAGGP